ncbi:hypothetical protein EW146_g849 [Bondarzewia mesenterica]|uniref:Fe2OG dioxygenase domain-containing protein n=1 Tax=Bondarzewia mesenterica TaxID=1095465 RepID=A0A4S4M7X3_9AGAM|nr:hypothetical protein EW146_g849 [Bondarzewia mesenterica]
MPATYLPPFPDDVPTVPLLVIDYALIKAGNVQESDRLWQAATELGFWYLKNHDVDQEAEEMFDMGASTLDLPMSEKMEYEQGDSGSSFGYKHAGAWTIDEKGTLDAVEFLNIAKDDVLAWPQHVHRTYPRTVNDRMQSTIKPYVRKALDISFAILAVFEKRLGLPRGAIIERHAMGEASGSEARCIRSLPRPEIPADRSSLGAHTDFGTLTMIHNRLGGLQVLLPASSTWQYVKPIPGLVICNLGDAMPLWTGGILKSNLHRVVNPPKSQSTEVRWSLGFFTRPANNILLAPLVEESEIIAEVVARTPLGKDNPNFAPQTAGEWSARRVKYMRRKNQKGPQTWLASRGTEHAEGSTA